MRRIFRCAAATALGLLFLVAGGPARADTPSLGGYNVSADGNVVDILVDNTTGLAGVHPLSEADFPEAESTFQTGPFGSGLATVFWPGGPAADFGSLAPEVGFPSSSQPLYSQLYDPVRASAQYPSGPSSSTYPANGPSNGFEMQSEADSTGVTSTAMTDQQSTAAILGFSHAKGTSSATADTAAKAASSTDLSDVKLLGGLVEIGSISSTAQATSDGTKPATGSALTHVSGVTVLGQSASIGSDGLVLPNFAKSLGPITGPIVQNALKKAISGLGLTISEFPSTNNANGESYSASSGGLSVQIIPPASAAPLLEQAGQVLAPLFPSQAGIIPTLPGILQGFAMTITLGRATASTNASPPFNSSFSPPPIPTSLVGSAPSGVTSSPVPAGSVSPVSGGASFAPTGTGSSASPAGTATPGGNIGAASLVGLSSPLGAGAVVAGIVVAALAGFGLWRLARTLLPQDVEPVCPLGQDNS